MTERKAAQLRAALEIWGVVIAVGLAYGRCGIAITLLEIYAFVVVMWRLITLGADPEETNRHDRT